MTDDDTPRRPFDPERAIAEIPDEMERIIAREIAGLGYRFMRERAKRVATALRSAGYDR